MKERLEELGVVAWLLIVAVVAMFIFGGASLAYKQTLGKAHKDVDREIFEYNKSHVHAMIEDLSKYKLELARTDDEVERKAIIGFISENYATFDSGLIENDSLRYFLNDVMEGRIE